MRELKCCPFCGGVAKQIFVDRMTCCNAVVGIFRVQCEACKCRTEDYKTIVELNSDGKIILKSNGAEDAVRAWNNRTGKVDMNEWIEVGSE